MKVFQIQSNELIYQTQISLPNHGLGPIDIEIDNANSILFISYEGTRIIDLYDSRYLSYITSVTLTGTYYPANVTGLCYDASRDKLYCTDRDTKHLYAYTWNAANHTLSYSTRVSLANLAYYACGLTKNGDTLFVSDYDYATAGGIHSQYVKAYAIDSNFAPADPNAYNMAAYAVSIDYNAFDNTLYSGAYGSTANKLAKFPLPSGPGKPKNAGHQIIGLEADPNTGILYATTYTYGYYESWIQAWDTSGWTAYVKNRV